MKKEVTKKVDMKKEIAKENPLCGLDETIFLPPPIHKREEMELFPMDADLDLWGKDFSIGKEKA